MQSLIPLIYLSCLIIFLTALNIYISIELRKWIQYQAKFKQITQSITSIQQYGNIALYALYSNNLDKAIILFYFIINVSNEYICINNAYYNLAIIYAKAQQKEITKFYYQKILNNDNNNYIAYQQLQTK